jgi:uncharacterized protein YjbI with pentapeptide repeats
MPIANEAEIMAGLQTILSGPDDDFEALVALSGLDPATDFIDADLSGLDLRHVNLDGYNLTNCLVSRGALPPKACLAIGPELVDVPFKSRNG